MSPDVQAGSDSDEFSYADASPFTKLFETKSRVKILDTLVRFSYEPLTQEEISGLADINQSSVSRNKDVLLNIGLVKQVESNPAKFQLDRSDPRTAELKKLHRQMAPDAERLHEDDVDTQREEVIRKHDLKERYEEQVEKGLGESSIESARQIRKEQPLAG